ncbi:DNA-binding response regulator, OmpR family, contains REC and winged-helix (wHTH) domain [Peptoclostridium litorale DSM 5388]|uniref:Stage 0 sporulation protein A homolog n=1 Tax=Peptoclostridium litorale DSM 5388 TaxID=1121324 RepID=A0A069REK6_PEPLI|nr:response regulator transcription factor [Peptoclostridium litorale]KDR95499.1 response regulator receiver [Peptoclostridium litorale DSM 5388]SIO17386.1 DNA-binding response regulator, OmpR family, contains REC and winged-helix (wHTH) domain [Peptoclostridium litorale DSM 5388]
MKRILIVEDDISIGEVEKDYLEISGFEVVVETDGICGLEKAINGEFDLVMLDVMLPGIDGFQICKDIRKIKDIPIIMVTARTEEIDKLRGLGLGIDDYITKPFSPNELIARVKAHLSRYDMLKSSGQPKSKRIEIRGLSIDPEARMVFVNGREVELTVKEYDLLLLLASTPNKVFSKEEIFTKVWGFDSDNDIPTITVHVRKLREKIEFDPSNPEYILTVWGVGYKFKA